MQKVNYDPIVSMFGIDTFPLSVALQSINGLSKPQDLTILVNLDLRDGNGKPTIEFLHKPESSSFTRQVGAETTETSTLRIVILANKRVDSLPIQQTRITRRYR
jgi:hypothetical protein